MAPATMNYTGSRRLLSRMRDVMAGQGSDPDKLARIVTLIAVDLEAEVCSVYLQRAGEVLELFATQGLELSAVHQTRLRVGEGLVGLIAAQARPLALSEAQEHPNFVFRPETGEEAFHSFLGVPVLRGGRVLGVLAVQNVTPRDYVEEEIETLETVAMVLAELVAGGVLVSRDETRIVDGIGLLPLRLEGMRLNGGVAIGQAVLHQPNIEVHKLVAEDPEAELRRLRLSVDDMHGALDNMVQNSEGEHRDILETYRMIAEDAGWLSRIEEAVASGLTAEAAVRKVQSDVRARMDQVSDPYLRERVHDLDDLANRLLQHLTGEIHRVGKVDGIASIILVARSLGPAELMDYDRELIKGLVLEEGSPTSHATILARAAGIPVVGRMRDLFSRVENGDLVIIDGDHGQLFVRPGDDVLTAFTETVTLRNRRLVAQAALRDEPAVSLDGVRIELLMNAGVQADMTHFSETGADGVGLYRTEVPFMARPSLPNVEDQTGLYGRVLDLAQGKPVAFRTLDVGGDKLLPYWDPGEEENPAMGWRAVRMSLDRPMMLRHQLRALVHAAAERELKVMFPMVTEIAEFEALRRLLDMELERAQNRGVPLPSQLAVGVMLEVPALAYQLPALLERVDFVSVGSNDLFQFLFAADRGTPLMAERYDVLSPPALNFLRTLLLQGARANVPVSICGEMAGKPLEAMALVGLGFRHLSMSPSAVAPIKEMIRSMEVAPMASYLRSQMKGIDHSLRERLRVYAMDHHIAL
ncbi:phosphoenolpyruvate--protein phosphotransferase [Magnetospira thiophila]